MLRPLVSRADGDGPPRAVPETDRRGRGRIFLQLKPKAPSDSRRLLEPLLEDPGKHSTRPAAPPGTDGHGRGLAHRRRSAGRALRGRAGTGSAAPRRGLLARATPPDARCPRARRPEARREITVKISEQTKQKLGENTSREDGRQGGTEPGKSRPGRGDPGNRGGPSENVRF